MHAERTRACSLTLTVLLLLSGSAAARAQDPIDEPDLVIAAIRDLLAAARR